jgi:phosphoserine phosphatase
MIVSCAARDDSDQGVVKMKKELLGIAKKLSVDIALQAEGLYRRAKRLIVFDMDSTLIQSEVIDELARHKGVYNEVAAITHAAMNGKMDFDESLKKRVAKLKGMSQADLLEVFQKVELTPGAEDLLRVLKKLGYKIGLISGGFSFVAERLKTKLGIDYVYANNLESKDGLLTGNVIPPIVNAQRKADLLDVIAQQEQVELDQVIAIGDGANDLPMLEKAGLGIAFNAKPTVREKADLSINQKNLKAVLYLLGLEERDLAVCFKTETLR